MEQRWPDSRFLLFSRRCDSPERRAGSVKAMVTPAFLLLFSPLVLFDSTKEVLQ